MRAISNIRIEPWASRPLADFRRCVRDGMGLDLPPEGDANLDRIVDRSMSFAAIDNDRVAGMVGAYRFDLSLPGGQAPAVGTTLVVVLPTHRRRGLLRTLLEQHLAAAREQGRALAGLWASEAAIYGRFGYGSAADRGQWRIDVPACRPRRTAPAGAVTLYEAHEAKEALRAVYARHWRDRAGMLERSDIWWSARRLDDSPFRRGGFGPLTAALHACEGGPSGYVLYRRKSGWQAGLPKDEVAILEMVGSDASRRALWAFMLSMDLIDTITATSLPTDDVVPLLVEDPRRTVVTAQDALWVRLLDVPAVLSARRYRWPGRLTLGVRPSPFALEGLDHGTFQLEAGPIQTTCEPIDAAPDLTLDLADLGSLAFGGLSATRLAAAGRIEGSPTAIEKADRMFGTTRAPWAAEQF